MVITFDQETIGLISAFEKYTNASVKDCYKNAGLVFIVKKGDMGKAIGRNAKNVQKLSRLFNKPVSIIEYSEDSVKFLKNLTQNANGKIYKSDENTVVIDPVTSKDKGIILGRDKKNLKHLQEIMSQHHKVIVKVI